MKAKQTPSIGRIVHYVAYGTPGGEYQAGAHRAAVVTDVVDPGSAHGCMLMLCVINPSGLFFNMAREDQTGTEPGSWHWPEFVSPETNDES
jgi:hypothetical protein